MPTFKDELRAVTDELVEMLAHKNECYGDSALSPVRIFSRASVADGLAVRIDDKLSRIARGQDAGEDAEIDLLGYLILRRVAKARGTGAVIGSRASTPRLSTDSQPVNTSAVQIAARMMLSIFDREILCDAIESGGRAWCRSCRTWVTVCSQNTNSGFHEWCATCRKNTDGWQDNVAEDAIVSALLMDRLANVDDLDEPIDLNRSRWEFPDGTWFGCARCGRATHASEGGGGDGMDGCCDDCAVDVERVKSLEARVAELESERVKLHDLLARQVIDRHRTASFIGQPPSLQQLAFVMFVVELFDEHDRPLRSEPIP